LLFSFFLLLLLLQPPLVHAVTSAHARETSSMLVLHSTDIGSLFEAIDF
jgi:hypothetical protein